jgi:hypothetical protein
MKQGEHCCESFASTVEDSRVPVAYQPRFRGRVLSLQAPDEETVNGWRRADSPQQAMAFCPHCGTRFASDLGSEWYDTLEAMGFDEPFRDDIPEEFRSDRWWKERGL